MQGDNKRPNYEGLYELADRGQERNDERLHNGQYEITRLGKLQAMYDKK